MNVPLFEAGQRVRIHDRTPPVHHRVPSYVKGHVGTVERVCGMHGEPEKFIRGDGNPRQRIYRIKIQQENLWREYQGSARDCLEVEIFEHWLEAAE